MRRTSSERTCCITTLSSPHASYGARTNTKRGNLAAAGGDVGEASGTEACQEATKFSAKQVRRGVDEHIAEFNMAVRSDVGENFAANGDALLNNPTALFWCAGGRNGASDGGIPFGFAGFPPKSNPRTAVFVVGL